MPRISSGRQLNSPRERIPKRAFAEAALLIAGAHSVARAVALIPTVILYCGCLIAGGVHIKGLRGVSWEANLHKITVLAAELGGGGTRRATIGLSGTGANGGGDEAIRTTSTVLTDLKTTSRY